MTYEQFRPQTLNLLRKFHSTLWRWHSMDDLIQDSWIAYLETGRRYKPKNAAHFFSLYRKLLTTRLAKLYKERGNFIRSHSVELDDDGVLQELADLLPGDELSPERQAMLDQLPFDWRLAMTWETKDADVKVRMTTDMLIDETVGVPGAARMIREAMK